MSTPIQTVGIIGAGTMGNGIAQACAVSGIDVVMVDISDAAVQKGLATVAGSLDRLLKKDKIKPADKDAALARIRTSTRYEDMAQAQLVIEAATENFDLKELLRVDDSRCPVPRQKTGDGPRKCREECLAELRIAPQEESDAGKSDPDSGEHGKN